MCAKAQKEQDALWTQMIQQKYGQHKMEALCIAAMLNSTIVDPTWIGNERRILLAELEDYFRYNRVESGQFNEAAVVKFIDMLDQIGRLGHLLHDMGTCPFDCDSVGMYHPSQWECFIAALCEPQTEVTPLHHRRLVRRHRSDQAAAM